MALDYQDIGAEFLANRPRAILADDAGVGKTRQATLACKLVDAKSVLVVCPAIARTMWERELPVAAVVSFEGAASAGLALSGADVLIIDEIHYLGNRLSQRTKVLLGDRCDGNSGIMAGCRYVWGLTGTPTPRDPSQLWPALHALFLEEFSESYTSFVRRYCKLKSNGFGMQIVGAKNVPELQVRLRPYVLRRLEDDAGLDLPPLTIEPLVLQAPERHDLDGVAGKVLAALEAGDEKKLRKLHRENAAEMREFGLARAAAVADLVRRELNSGALDKVVLGTWHKDVAELLRQELALREVAVRVITGATSATSRQEAIDTFQSNPRVRVIITQIKAAGVAVTLHAACEAIAVELSWVPGDNMQWAKRIHRRGQTRPCRVRYASLPGADEKITKALKQRADGIAALWGRRAAPRRVEELFV